MGLQFVRGRESKSEQLFYKVLVYGHSGAGKTWLAASAPNPIVLLTEQNGIQSVRMSNPNARYAYTSSIEDVRDLLRAANSRTLGTEQDPVDTIVIDGLTEIQRMFKDEMMRERQTEEFSIAMWGELTEKMRRLLRLLRDVPYHVVCTALAETEMEGETRHVFPAFQGKKLYDEVMQYFNAVAYVFKTQKGEEIVHNAMFDGPSRIAAKNCHPIRGTRVGPVSTWIAEFRDAAPNAVASAASPAPEAQKPEAAQDPKPQDPKPQGAKPEEGKPEEEGKPAAAPRRRLAGRKPEEADNIPT